jgi:hypothetical protein
MRKHASHYHVVAADMIGSSRFLRDNRDELYKIVLDDFYKMIRNTQLALSKKYRFIERDRLAGIYPIGGDSFWLFIPASREDQIVGDSFFFTTNVIQKIKKEFSLRFNVYGLGIRIGVHTTVKEKMPDGSTGWVNLDEGIGKLKKDEVYKMPLFNRIFSRDFVVARRLEQASQEKSFIANTLFSREFVHRMIDYGGISSSRRLDQKIHIKLKNGSKLVFARRFISEVDTETIREKLEECRVTEFYELI